MTYMRERDVPVSPPAAVLLPGSWRRWEQAFDAYDSGDEAENFQAVGVRLHECLVSFIGETKSDDLVPDGAQPPKGSDFKGWTELLANHLAAGPTAGALRSYLKRIAVETWDYVNWLTHAKNAVRMDAEIALKMVEHLIGSFTAARLRLEQIPSRCSKCGSYRVTAGRCSRCGEVDPSYVPVELPVLDDNELAHRLQEPCTPSSDISTFMSPRDSFKG